jgi:glycosyltransferase involved in cell wall biosynthesis
MRRRLRVIYACPFAHYSGHHPHAATVEPGVLAKAGLDVILVTFCGITNNPEMLVPHFSVMPNLFILRLIRRATIPRWFLMLGETIATLAKAMWIYRRWHCDAIYVRDGEPFLFISHLLSLPFRNLRWVVSLTGAILFVPKPTMFKFHENPFIYFYTVALYVVSGKIWYPLYRFSLSRNSFMFVTQNIEAQDGYAKHFNGVFGGHVVCIPLGINGNEASIPKPRARAWVENKAQIRSLEDKVVLLSFGAAHSGKDMNTVFRAAKLVPDVFLVYAGTQAFSLGSNPEKLAQQHEVEERTAIFKYYVPEEEKPYFFNAADAMVLSYTKVFKCTSSMVWEAAKYNLPIISSNANTLGEIVGEYNLGLLFEAEDDVSLVDAIRRFRAISPADIERMKAGCARFISDFSHKRWAERTIGVFQEVVQ